TRLYQLLKKKEDAEESYEESIQETTPIEIIRQQMDYIEMLSRKIVKLEQDVQNARMEMENKHGKLKDAHVEVKKFEKIIKIKKKKKKKKKKNGKIKDDHVEVKKFKKKIQNRKQSAKEMEKKLKKKTMDEISIKQYLAKQK